MAVGLIHRFDEFLRDLRRRRWDSAMFSGGLERILYGLAKLIVIGNYLVEQKLALAIAPALSACMVSRCLFHRVAVLDPKLYVLFSGYSDMRDRFRAPLMGFGLRENFNWPMLARNIGEFWRRWHMIVLVCVVPRLCVHLRAVC